MADYCKSARHRPGRARLPVSRLPSLSTHRRLTLDLPDSASVDLLISFRQSRVPFDAVQTIHQAVNAHREDGAVRFSLPGPHFPDFVAHGCPFDLNFLQVLQERVIRSLAHGGKLNAGQVRINRKHRALRGQETGIS